MTLPIVTDFENAKRDIDDLASIVTSADSIEIETRLGEQKPTITKVIHDINERVNVEHNSLLANVKKDADEVRSLVPLAVAAEQAKTDAKAAAQQNTDLMNALLTEEKLLEAAENLLQPVVANMGCLALKNCANAHKIKILGVNSL